MEFIAATNNSGKLAELVRIFGAMGHTVISQKQAEITAEPEENGKTFEENAIIKAKYICEISNKPTIADDSGIEVDALDGAPGVYTARYCGRHGDDKANNDLLLKNLQGLKKEQRAAKFVSAVCLYMPNGKYITARGECPGWIGFEYRGTNGFGYDPIFNIEMYDNRSYAQLTNEEKDKISHRGKAVRELASKMPQFLKENS